MDNSILSQEEIDALLSASGSQAANEDTSLTDEEKDVIGEIGNISMGTSATTLYTLLHNKVSITTPMVEIMTWDELKEKYIIPYVGILVEYTEGLKGFTMLILEEGDAKKIADLMMGGDGENAKGELTELDLSAVGEAMNQMMGSAATSMSGMLSVNINISPPKIYVVKFDSDEIKDIPIFGHILVKTSFKMVVGNVINSEIMQLIPLEFAKTLVSKLLSKDNKKDDESDKKQTVNNSENIKNDNKQMPDAKSNRKENKALPKEAKRTDGSIDVKPVYFQEFSDTNETDKETNNKITLIKDVPLEVTVELGRTKKMIKDILELSPGSLIELDKIAGEPVDILVNGKLVAKGEVVVIDENFGVRILNLIN